MRIILYGAGKKFSEIYNHLINNDKYELIAVIDKSKNAIEIDNKSITVKRPEYLHDTERYDYIVITSEVFFSEISEYLIKEIGIDIAKIKHSTFLMANEMLDSYESENIDDEQKEVLEYIRMKEQVRTFNYSFVEKYKSLNIDVYFDNEENLFYVIRNGKKLYFSERFDSTKKVADYYRELLIEQDEKSPHRYIQELKARNGVIIDAGSAEGIFALDNIEKASKVYLIEADNSWNKALCKTFERYLDKIVIINKFLSDVDDNRNICIDKITSSESIDFIKMDIEGYEYKALMGAKKYLSSSSANLDICVYHNENDEREITNLLKKHGFIIDINPGYMVFTINKKYPLKLVRGVIHAKKNS